MNFYANVSPKDYCQLNWSGAAGNKAKLFVRRIPDMAERARFVHEKKCYDNGDENGYRLLRSAFTKL